jgi:hypothetical protein
MAVLLIWLEDEGYVPTDQYKNYILLEMSTAPSRWSYFLGHKIKKTMAITFILYPLFSYKSIQQKGVK